MSENNVSNNDAQDAEIEKLVTERMGHISSELAHDLRSPLQTIQNAIYLLQKSPENPMLFDMIKQSLKQATHLLDSFRDYYKGHIINPIETEYTKIIDLAFSDLEIPDNIEIRREVHPVIVRVDPAKTALAIRNLIQNSLDAMPEGGVLQVIINETEHTTELKIIDNGAGILPESEKSVFVPFDSKKKQGKGLGVPTAKKVIESHGGAISYTTKIGEGTIFSIVLPKITEKL